MMFPYASRLLAPRSWLLAPVFWIFTLACCLVPAAFLHAHPGHSVDYSEKMMKAYQNLVKGDPEDVEARVYLGEIYELRQMYKEAEEQYKKAVSLAPDHEGAAYDMASLYLKLEKHQTALKWIQKVKNPPLVDHAHILMGDIYLAMKKESLAVAAYNKAAQLNPKNANAHVQLGSYYYDKMNYEKAIASFNKALKVDPTNFNARRKLADVYGAMKKYKEKITHLMKLAELVPEGSPLWGNIRQEILQTEMILKKTLSH